MATIGQAGSQQITMSCCGRETIKTTLANERACLPCWQRQRLILLGYLGRKTGRGFYDYSRNPPVAADLGL